MSEIKVNSIKGVAPSTAALTINNTDGTCTANLTNRTNKNLIINGAMQVAQRGTSFTASGSYPVDRFDVQQVGTDEAPTMAQVDISVGTTPYTSGFRKAIKITNGNQTSGAGAGDYIYIRQKIEAQNVANSGWNYTSASSFVNLSFWIKSSVAQTFYGYLETSDGTAQLYSFSTGALSADTWTKVTKKIPGGSNITINNDNGIGLSLQIVAFIGTTYTTSGNTLEQWANAGGFADIVPDNTSTWYTTNDATLEITGVQLEVGSVATDFEHRSFAQELALCERYCLTLCTGQQYIGTCMLYNSLTHTAAMVWKTTMRAAPTMVANSGTDYYITYRNGGQSTYNSLTGTSLVSANGGAVYTSNGSGTAGHAGAIAGANASTLVLLTAEL